MANPLRPKPGYARLPRTFRAFEDPNFRLLWPGNLLSYTSRWMQIILLAWLVLNKTHSPSLVALVGFFAWAPLLPLGLLGGVLADTLHRQKLLASMAAANLVAALLLTALLLRDSVAVWHAYLVIAISGTAWALDMPSRRAIILDMFGRTGVTNGLALDSMAMSLSLMLGPMLAGVLIGLADVKGGYVVVSTFYLLATVLLLGVRVRQASRPTSDKTKILGSLAEGVRFVRGNRALRGLLLITMLMNLLLFTHMPMVPVIATDVLKVGPGLLGLLSGAAGLGSFVGALVIASLVNVRHHGRLVVIGAMVAMLGLLVFSISRWYILSFPALFLLGLGISAFAPAQFTLFMLLAPERMRGKVLGVISLAIGTNPLGALLLTAVIGLTGPSFALGLNATVGLLGLALIAGLVPILRQPTESLQAPRE